MKAVLNYPQGYPANARCKRYGLNLRKKNGFYFIIFTCYKWMRMYEELKMYGSVCKHLNNFVKKGETIWGYVIMPNPIHLLAYHKEENGTLKNMVGNLKRFMADDIVELYEQSDKVNTLLEMKKGVTTLILLSKN